jgi:uncharacterized protein YqiB (DUF1249 family)
VVLKARFIFILLDIRLTEEIRLADIYRSIYDKLEKIGVFGVRQYAVIEKPPFVPLCIDRLEGTVYALSQNPVIDGEMVAEPDMEIRVFHDKKIAEPLCLQDRNGRRAVYPEPGRVDLEAKHDLAKFLDRWLSDLISHGFIRHQ